MATKIIQITNIAPQATKDQMAALFGFFGAIIDIRMYPTIRDVAVHVTTRICFIKFVDSDSVAPALHLTNTVFIDRALIISAYTDPEIPDEKAGLEISTTCPLIPGVIQPPPKLPPHVSNLIDGIPPNQVLKNEDPNLTKNGLPQYPSLPIHFDAKKVEEIRRTLVVGNLNPEVSADEILSFFKEAGEVKYFRFCSRPGDPIKYGLIEFSEQSSIITGLQMNGRVFEGHKLRLCHSNQAIIKPQPKSNEAAQKEIEEALHTVKENQMTAALTLQPAKPAVAPVPNLGFIKAEPKVDATIKKSHSRSRSKSRRRSRSTERSRKRSRSRSYSRRRSRSRDRHRSHHSSSKKRSRSRDRHRSSRRRSRTPRRHSSRSRRSSSRSRRDRDRSKDRKRDKDRDRERSKTKDDKHGKAVDENGTSKSDDARDSSVDAKMKPPKENVNDKDHRGDRSDNETDKNDKISSKESSRKRSRSRSRHKSHSARSSRRSRSRDRDVKSSRYSSSRKRSRSRSPKRRSRSTDRSSHRHKTSRASRSRSRDRGDKSRDSKYNSSRSDTKSKPSSGHESSKTKISRNYDEEDSYEEKKPVEKVKKASSEAGESSDSESDSESSGNEDTKKGTVDTKLNNNGDGNTGANVEAAGAGGKWSSGDDMDVSD